jgi:hypothetical protein
MTDADIIALAILQYEASDTAEGSPQRQQLAEMRKGVSDTDLSLAKQCSVG